MFRNLATLILYIAILFFNVQLPPPLLLLYTLFMFLGDSYEYFPEKMKKRLNPIWNFFEIQGPFYYNIEFLPIVLLSLYLFITTLYKSVEEKNRKNKH